MAFRIVRLQMGLGVRIGLDEDRLVPVVVQAGFFQMVDRIDLEAQDQVFQLDPDQVRHKLAVVGLEPQKQASEQTTEQAMVIYQLPSFDMVLVKLELGSGKVEDLT